MQTMRRVRLSSLICIAAFLVVVVSKRDSISAVIFRSTESIVLLSNVSFYSEHAKEAILDNALLSACDRRYYAWSVRPLLSSTNTVIRIKANALSCYLSNGRSKYADPVLQLMQDDSQERSVRLIAIAMAKHLVGHHDKAAGVIAAIIRSSSDYELRRSAIEVLWYMSAITTNVDPMLYEWMLRDMNRHNYWDYECDREAVSTSERDVLLNKSFPAQ